MSARDIGALAARVVRLFLFGSLLLLAGTAQAESRYGVYLDNGCLLIGELVLEAMGRDDGYRFTLDDTAFGDYFLSMRPFKCVTYGPRMLCYTPYPYTNRHNIGREDLTDLEYDLLFIARTPREYGIDPWNGRYFKLQWWGDNIVGVMNEADLNILVAPPEDGNVRPLVESDLSLSVASESNWTPRLLIEPLAQ